MIIGLLIAAQTAAVSVERTPRGAEILAWPSPDPWSEVRLVWTTPPEPKDRPGLGQVAAAVLEAALRPSTLVGPTASVRRAPDGLVLAFGARPERVPAAIDDALGRLLALDVPEATLRSSVQSALHARQVALHDDEALAHRELTHILSGRAPPEGTVRGVGALSREEVRRFLARTLRAGRTRLVVTGTVATDDLRDRLAVLPVGSSSVAATLPAASGPPLEIVVVDKPGRSRAIVALGWRPSEPRSEAISTVAAATLGPGASWHTPTLRLVRTATVGDEPEVVQAALQSMRRAATAAPSPARWRAAVRTSTSAVALALRDAPHAADALALDRAMPGRTLRPVLWTRLAAQTEPPPGITSLFKPERAVVVVVTSAKADLVARLAGLEEDATVRVVAWDQR